MYSIENNFLKINVKESGAELCSIFNKKTGIEYLWQAGKEWQKHSPILFPVVGQLMNNTYFYKNQPYKLERHGFARNKNFSIGNSGENNIEFILKEDTSTLAIYPFHFELRISYTLEQEKLIVGYSVANKSNNELLFSIGAHPAFKIPLTENESYEDYYLEFNEKETALRWKLTNGLISDEREIILNNTKILPLKKSLFYEDALVFKNLKSEQISVKSNQHDHGISFSFSGFPYFGIWAAKDADFICLEPWHGIADSVSHNQKLEDKEGIISLKANANFNCNYSIELF